MKITASQYSSALRNIFQEISANKTENTSEVYNFARKFLGYIKRHGDMKKLPAILQHLQKQEDFSHGIRRIQLTSAHQIDEEQLHDIEREAKKIFASQNIIITTQKDAACIGGYKLSTDTEILDKTVRTQLEKLQHNLWR